MKNRAISGIALILPFLAGCTTVANETRISSALRAIEFNDVASQYMERPTFVSIQSFSDRNTALKVEMDEYGTGYDPALKIVTPHLKYFDKRFVANYLPLIDKYLEWDALATERGDQIERDIGKAQTWGNGAEVTLDFSIYSGSAGSNYLTIKSCAVGTCGDKHLMLTRTNAIVLRKLLADFGSGTIGLQNLDGVYK